MIGILLAILNGVLNFLWLPVYPLWAIVLIGLNVLIIGPSRPARPDNVRVLIDSAHL